MLIIPWTTTLGRTSPWGCLGRTADRFCHSFRYEEGLACFDRVLELEPNHALCKTTRALTLAAIPNPIKLPKMRKIEAENPPLEAEATVQIRLTREREFVGEVGEMELD